MLFTNRLNYCEKDKASAKTVNYTVYVAVVYGDGNYERFSTLGKTVQSQHIRIKIKGTDFTSMEQIAAQIRQIMTQNGHIQIGGIIGLDENAGNMQIALDYKVLS